MPKNKTKPGRCDSAESSIPPRPYPTPLEIIRELALALGTRPQDKKLAKKLDDAGDSACFDPRFIDEALEAFIVEPFKKLGTIETGEYKGSILDILQPRAADELAETFRDSLNGALAAYRGIVEKIQLVGVDRQTTLARLSEGFFPWITTLVLSQIREEIDAPPLIGSENPRAVTTVLNWIAENIPGWKEFVRTDLGKKVSKWRTGTDLPSFKVVQSLGNRSESADCVASADWVRVRVLLLLARAIDHFDKHKLGPKGIDKMREFALATDEELAEAVFRPLADAQHSISERDSNLVERFWTLANDLSPTRPKPANARERTRIAIDEARVAIEQSGVSEDTLHMVEWLKARWCVLSGDLKTAQTHYEKAFYGSLFRGGSVQIEIIQEAMVVAAAQPKPRMVWLKQFKHMAHYFRMDVPGVDPLSGTRRDAADQVVADWEIRALQSHLHEVFPDCGMFAGCSLPRPSDSGSIKPDYRYPDKKVTVGKGRTKQRMPQLVHFVKSRNVEVVRELLARGARVNVHSEVGDTPIGLATAELNAFSLDPSSLDLSSLDLLPLDASLDDTIFWMLAECRHTTETVNRINSKERNVPIWLAVQSGRPDIVKKLIELGADVNVKGGGDYLSPLYQCVQTTNFARTNSKSQQALTRKLAQLERGGGAMEDLKSMARYTPAGMIQPLQRALRDPGVQATCEMVTAHADERMVEHIKPDNMEAIARELLAAGADPNSEHTLNGISGYTSLMLAAELDELALFQLMHDNGGDIDKQTSYDNGRVAGCWDIAVHFSADRVLKYLQESPGS